MNIEKIINNSLKFGMYLMVQNIVCCQKRNRYKKAETVVSPHGDILGYVIEDKFVKFEALEAVGIIGE